MVVVLSCVYFRFKRFYRVVISALFSFFDAQGNISTNVRRNIENVNLFQILFIYLFIWSEKISLNVNILNKYLFEKYSYLVLHS